MKKPMGKTPADERAMEPDPVFAPVAEAFAGEPDVTRGRMMASFGLKVNGRIFTMLARGCFVAKLPKARVDELVDAGVGEHFDPGHGRRMKEWISIEPGRGDWVALAREAHRFVKDTRPEHATCSAAPRRRRPVSIGGASSIRPPIRLRHA